MYGYSEMAYLDGNITVGSAGGDGYTPILSDGREVVYVATLGIPELARILMESAGIDVKNDEYLRELLG